MNRRRGGASAENKKNQLLAEQKRGAGGRGFADECVVSVAVVLVCGVCECGVCVCVATKCS
jgi:hypothetical protein